MNEFLFFMTIAFYFAAVSFSAVRFGKTGIYCFIVFACIMASVEVCLGVKLFGVECTLGNVAFGSVFLGVDMLNEIYGERDAKNAAILAGIIMMLTAAISALNGVFTPSEYDFGFAGYNALFAFVPRTNFASVICFVVASILNCKLFNAIKRRTGESKLWLRNNVSTIITNGCENFVFYLIAFGGTISMNEILVYALTATVIEIFVALLDTPFLYWVKYYRT